MKSTILFVLAFAVLASATPPRKITNTTDLKSLSTIEKFSLFVLSGLDLEPKPQLDIPWKSLFAYDDYPETDPFFVDLRAIIVQSIKIKEDAPLAAFDFNFRFEMCDWYNCYNITFNFTSGITQLKGQARTTSVNVITPTHFKNTFTVPLFQWHADDFYFEIANHVSGVTWKYSNSRLNINNMRLTTQFDYEFVPELGIQIRNLDIDFLLLSARFSILNYRHEYDDGTILPLPPIVTDYVLALLAEWLEVKAEYQTALEFRINCVLSGFRNDPERCTPTTDEGYFPNSYYVYNVMELFETIGLASLDRTDLWDDVAADAENVLDN
ncbi:unnamed protein product [Orchesella dallaii]|uniref:Uncharacterized protein n=1 Tax=Orchesella dallaii TaxID=48710 RepID=A0ABP1S486_9HEXA